MVLSEVLACYCFSVKTLSLLVPSTETADVRLLLFDSTSFKLQVERSY